MGKKIHDNLVAAHFLTHSLTLMLFVQVQALLASSGGQEGEAAAPGRPGAGGEAADWGGAEGAPMQGRNRGRSGAFSYIAPSEALLRALGRWLDVALPSAPNRAAVLLEQYRSGASPTKESGLSRRGGK